MMIIAGGHLYRMADPIVFASHLCVQDILAVKRDQKDWESSSEALERLQTKIFLDAQDVAATLTTLGKDLDSGAPHNDGTYRH